MEIGKIVLHAKVNTKNNKLSNEQTRQMKKSNKSNKGWTV
jgi:hypothetical protein